VNLHIRLCLKIVKDTYIHNCGNCLSRIDYNLESQCNIIEKFEKLVLKELYINSSQHDPVMVSIHIKMSMQQFMWLQPLSQISQKKLGKKKFKCQSLTNESLTLLDIHSF